jgi:hypothetical protein
MIGWVLLLAVTGASLLHLSKDQPFVEISRTHGLLQLVLAGLMLVAMNSPRQFDQVAVGALFVTVLGGLQVMAGVRHMASTRRDVIVAPMAGILLCFGAVAMLVDDWLAYSRTEQAAAFALASSLVIVEIYLFFRGMIVGTTARMWSAAGLRQCERELLRGPRGAIACFDRAWDMDEQYINAMSHAALLRIHTILGDQKSADFHHERLQRLGGESGVDETWLKAVDKTLRRVTADHSEE